MNIIFDEKKYAEKLLKTGFRKFMNYQDLLILSKYFRYLDNDNREIRNKLYDFCVKFFPEYNEILDGWRLNSAIRNTEKYSLRLPVNIFVTIDELQNIKNINNFKYEKILFIMLIIAKNFKLSNNKTYEGYYVNYNFSTILTLSRVYANKKEREFIKHDLFELGKIQAIYPNRKFDDHGKDNFKLLYVDNCSASAICINDFENIIDFYPVYCNNCGKQIEKKYKQKYNLCDNCYKEKRNKDTLIRMNKYRDKFVTQ